MYTVGIFFEGKGWTEWRVDGCEAAYEAYRAACVLAAAAGAVTAAIWDTETTEVLADLASEDEAEDYEPDYDECGFDPYEGCYTFDC